MWVPPVRVRDNIQLESDAYRILVGGREVARGLLRPDRWLAINPGATRVTLEGEATKDPAFGLPATWIAEGDRQLASSRASRLWTPPACSLPIWERLLGTRLTTY